MGVKALLAAGIATAAALSACGGTAESASGTVRLLTHESFVLSQSLIDDFQARTGLVLEVVTAGDAGSMVAGAILAAGAPTADVLFGVDNTLRSRAVGAGVFAPYASSAADALRPELRDDTAGGLLTPVDFGDVCVNIDDGFFASAGLAPPSTLEDLASPEYRDLLVVEDPGTSSPGLAFLLSTVARYGDQWPDYWRRLAANGVTVAGSWTDAYMGDFTKGGGGGDRPLVVSYATSPPAEIVYASDPKPERPSTSVMPDGCYRQVEYAGVLAGASNPAGAQAVLDWLLSPEVQADLPLSMFVLPARDGVALPDVFTRFAPAIANPLQIAADEVAAGVPDWLAEWGAVMGR
ncbi:MAG: thiamine ABC transporter substrate-binding protein [Actinomycetota bacterium]|nr:thiamine ABC transporter substrate-binding protein [Actinomycetota bacterium]